MLVYIREPKPSLERCPLFRVSSIERFHCISYCGGVYGPTQVVGVLIFQNTLVTTHLS